MKPPVTPAVQAILRRGIPRWVWISAAAALVLVPVLLVWLTLNLLSGARQAGSGLVEQALSLVGIVAPEVAREADAALAQVRETADALAPLAADPVEAVRATVDAKVAEAAAAVREPLAEASADLADKAAAAATLAGAAALAGPEVEAITERGRATVDAALGSLAPLPTTDVAGEDPEGFTRAPGFVRTAFRRGDDWVEASYVGVAPKAEVLAFHRQALEQAGYTAVVQAADATATTIEFRKQDRTLLLSMQSGAGGRTQLEVRSG